MKRKILTALMLVLAVGLFVTFIGCNPGSKNQSKTVSVEPAPVISQETIDGIFEFPTPLQGYGIFLDNYYLIISGDSDSTMFCEGGSYQISGETITNTILFDTDSNNVGNIYQWKVELSEGDTAKVTLFDKDGNISQTLKSVRKVSPAEIKNQMMDIEGFFQYLPPNQGISTNLAGYYIFLFGQSNDTMIANAGTYKNQNDTITCQYLFSTDPQLVGGEFRWINPSTVGATFTYAVLDDMGEITATGQCERIK